MHLDTERELLDAAFERLRDLLADDEGMELRPHSADLPDSGRETAWQVSAPNHTSPLLVEAFRRFTPRDADRVLGGVTPFMRKMLHNPPLVVVAPWLSPRSRQLLTERGINYIDLTGNVRLRVARPSIYLRLDGAQQDPNPRIKPPVRLRGAGVNALVRILVDVEPPYRMLHLAEAAGLSPAYVSRTLAALDEERLIERDPQTRVVSLVDWQGLLRARAEHYGLLRSNRYESYIARTGANALYRRLATTREQVQVTGSYAVSEYVSLAAPAQLALYVPSFDEFARRHELLPANQGADVVLLRAADKSQLDRTRQVESGTFHVGISQLALDCLGGNGRLPEEGDALLEWMYDNIARWRSPHLSPR
ncbi:helix-turn-helix domain-containing protein [Phytohabitans suffuscus]|uniref:HTH crp-type domain-containing protein n=1 Tax=Phytohabitans suffuscus TaxID=624315 RepID=A0A6F8YFZ3_9ACTN|nr:helix-turn-helix domain-containing protein [Phytohabitans suffuscus]BCB84953.1 hypothetical protein Psuf_022660 [Phytohabitans suffuscus]